MTGFVQSDTPSPLACGRSVSCAAALRRGVGEGWEGGFSKKYSPPPILPHQGGGMTFGLKALNFSNKESEAD